MNNAYSFCSEPMLPIMPSSFSKPSAPYCLSGYSYTHKHTCSEWEINSYIDDVNRYIKKMNDFASEAVHFANEAKDYARCQIKEAKSELE